jgi:phage-related tail protein
MEALQAGLSGLAQRQTALAEADRRLTDTVASAHTVAIRALNRLDRIEAEIESAVSTHRTVASDAPAGARELQRFLIAKQREIIAVVTEATEQAATKTAVLQELIDAYRQRGGGPAG